MDYRIVADSSANILEVEGIPFSSAPLHIIVNNRDFADDANIDLSDMQHELSACKGKSSTSCPSLSEWIGAFGDSEIIFCITITSGLSGSYDSACAAKQIYEGGHPGRIVYVLDSLSTGPEMTLLVEKLRELILSGLPHEEIYREALAYMKRTHLLFALASLENFARNGRVNPILAKGMGILGIRVVGKASDEGTLEMLNKVRGNKKSIQCIIRHMKALQYAGGRIVIAHNHNEPFAEELKNAIAEEFGEMNGYIHETRGLCSYYAEPLSLLIGFEG